MEAVAVLRDMVILIGVAIPVVALAQKLRIPAIVGFLLAGVAIGPHGFGWIAPDSVHELAEIGVVLLLFTIGLELSLSQVMEMGRVVLQGGALQVGATLAAVTVLVSLAGVPFQSALFYGALVALSSTAIVLRTYADRDELDSPPGRVAVSILLFQDLCVVPLMILVPVLARFGEGFPEGVWIEVGKSLLVIALLIGLGQLVIPWVLDRVVLFRNRELFTMCVGFFGLGAAFLTSSFGLSLALGAFLAGLVISESEYGLQALSDVVPFRDMFSGIFFTSVGMLLDASLMASRPFLVVGLTVVVIVLKSSIVTLVVRSLRRPLEASLVSGLGLAQIGEFSFVLATVGAPLGLFEENHYQLFLAASVLSMLATPFLIQGARPLAGWIATQLGRPGLGVLPHEEPRVAGLRDHAVIVGYGLSGRHLARVLHAAEVPYVVLEQNGYLVRRAREEGAHVFFGDGTRREVLERIGIGRARVLVFAISSPAEERRGVAMAHRLNPALKIVVRTRYVRAIETLRTLGAADVIVEEFEATLELFARILQFYEIPSNTIQRELEAVRKEHYGMLRGKETPEMKLDALRHLGIHHALELVEVEEDSEAMGESPTSLDLRRETGAIVIAVVREGHALYRPDGSFRFLPGDTVVLIGDDDALAKAKSLFRAKKPAPSLAE